MTVYAYRAYSNDGKMNKGTLSADSAKHARQLLREKGYSPISVNQIDGVETSIPFTRLSFRRVSTSDLALLTRELAALVGAHLPVEEALATLSKQVEKKSLVHVVMQIHERIRSGFSLAKSLQEFPNIFPKMYTATIAAGEESGHLSEVLEHLADHLERQQQIQSKIKQALIYPSIMTVVALSVVIFLLIFIVPKLVEVFQNTNQSLPTMTIVLIGISHFLAKYVLLLIIAVFLAGFAFKMMLRRERFKVQYQNFLLHLPLLGKTLLNANVARFARTLGILLDAGVPLVNALNISQQVISLITVREAITHANDRITQGVSIHTALEDTKFFPPFMIHFIANGEATGKLGDMLQRAAKNQERKVTQLIDGLLVAFEPLLILCMGGIVLFIVLAVLVPMFQMTQMVS